MGLSQPSDAIEYLGRYLLKSAANIEAELALSERLAAEGAEKQKENDRANVKAQHDKDKVRFACLSPLCIQGIKFYFLKPPHTFYIVSITI